MVLVCHFQPISYDLRIVVEMAHKPSLGQFGKIIGSLTMPVSGLVTYLDHLWDMVGVCRFQPRSYELCIVVKVAFLEVIGSPTMPESGLRDPLDHLWDMVGVVRFQPTLYDLRIVVKVAQKPALRTFWKLLEA